MNTEPMLKVAESIEKGSLRDKGIGYNQNNWWERKKVLNTNGNKHDYECDTNACIAGWTCALVKGKNLSGIISVSAEGGRLLGLTELQKSILFYPTYNDPTPEWAGMVMRDMVAREQANPGSNPLPRWEEMNPKNMG